MAKGSGVPELPGGGGGPEGLGNWSNAPNINEPKTAAEALGTKGAARSMDDATMNTNPYYSTQYSEFSANCQRCTTAYEARRRGYNVNAQPTFYGDELPRGGGYLQSFKNPKTDIVSAAGSRKAQAQVENLMAGYGNGSRAIMAVQWKNSKFGHVVNVEMRNGKVHYRDGQVGGKYNPKGLFNSIKTGNARIELTRVDHLEFSNDIYKFVEPARSR